MSSDDVDPEALIAHFAYPLLPADRAAFRTAAESALAQLSCSGPGIAHRALAELQHLYFSPPADARVAHAGPRPFKGGKLTAAAPIGASDPREGARARRQFRVVG
jgi:hypothetical protein